MALLRPVLLLILFLAAPLRAQEEKPRVLLIGDSISMGYTQGVQERLAEVALVERNPGNARHTGIGLEKLDAWLGEEPWDLIHFNWGLHDLCYRDTTAPNPQKRDKVKGTLEHTVEEYEANLRKIVARLQATGAKLVFATTTPVPEGEIGRVAHSELDYNDAARRVMREAGVPINDLHAFIAPRFGELGSKPGDVHFKKPGSALLAGRVARVIAAQLQLGLEADPLLGLWKGTCSVTGCPESFVFYEDGRVAWQLVHEVETFRFTAPFVTEEAEGLRRLKIGPIDDGFGEGMGMPMLFRIEADSVEFGSATGSLEVPVMPPSWDEVDERVVLVRG